MYGKDTGHGRGFRRRGMGAVAVGAALLLSGCSGSSDDGNDEAKPSVSQQPKGEDPYWVNPDGNAARQVAAFEDEGKKDEARLVRRIAEQPVADWLGTEKPEEEARGFTEAAKAADREALLVLYNIPHRDCGNYSGGGAADGNAYRAFVDSVAKGIGDRPATVILEPDAVLHLVDGCTPEQFHEERYDLLKGAIQTLKALPATKVYLDAGNAGWGKPDQIFEPLTWAGVAEADGFSVNVSNFYSTEDSVAYGKELSAKVGNKPFVVDTSRNGNGPFTGGDPAERWCNPPGRALGEVPTTKTGDDLVDAYLWIKRPGESDGECKGGPKAGQWWPEYALGLAKAAK
ncbi:glycoside hydrolase family 6 protein [Streptomyces sp. KE1]|uniref:glycoside hydrolase family 6 protein n=1 Tax=Streptomyces sp. KE1 TaxID=1638939 RepID=UPI00063E6F41|nr:glycoside hydrolase family 6 protein [Streptomyces sp. KE1]KLJ03733.1 endoglucanase [Streptomyces sp. KE1]